MKKEMMMKKTVSIFCIMCVLLMQLAFAQGTAAEKITRGSNLQVTFLNQEPDPVGPGEALEVKFKVDNIGGEIARNVEFELLPAFPFSMQPGQSVLKNLGSIQRSQEDSTGAVVDYDLLVDDSAVEGDIEIDFRYRVDGGAWINIKDITIDIRTQDAILSVDAVRTEKELSPGSESPVTLTLANEADSNLRNIEVTLDLDDKPFVPIGSGNQKSTFQIKAGSKANFRFNLLVDPEASTGVYKIPVEITYLDEVGTEFSKESTIGLVIGGETDLSVTLDQTDIYQSGQAGEVTVKVVNKGLTDVKFMNIRLDGSENIRILSNDELYLGNIDSDDFESATYDIYVEESDTSQVVLPIVLEYKDANNKEFVDEIKLEMNLYSSNDAKKFGLVSGNGNMGIIVIVVVLVIGFFLYRRYKKRKNAKK